MAIEHFRHKGLKELFVKVQTKLIGKRYHANVLVLLDFLDAIHDLDDCQGVKGFHALSGKRKDSYSMRVSVNYRLTFRFNGQDVHDVDFEDYH
ncbi:MAG: type II toxin-antitoxin system RelE/ParE family toxin [Pirellulaceae bacterium]|nr:type II toxin-antitoxin system RelE/ParE family toxin [Pirellulaceae bacterium]